MTIITLLRFLFFLLLVGFILGANNGLAKLPPMGWMSWTAFYCETNCVTHPNGCINAELYMGQADRIVEDGYLSLGYTNVHIDDCWLAWNRDSNGRLVANATRFPNGISGLAQYIHSKGLKLGIYECVGWKTCAGYPGSYGYEEVDAQTFADWGVDHLKYDGCYSNETMKNIGFPKMGAALLKTGRPIVFSTEWWGFDSGNISGVAYYSNLERSGQDVSRSWHSIISIIDNFVKNQQTFLQWPIGPGFWMDSDMIVVGNHEITLDQAQAQMSIWSIWSAPLIMSNNLRKLPAGHKEILQNKYVIAVDQDPLGICGEMVNQTGNIMIFIKKMTPVLNNNIYSYAIALLNRDNITTTASPASFVFNDIGLNNPSGYNVMDLWAGKIVGTYKPSDTYTASVNPTGVNFIKAVVLQ